MYHISNDKRQQATAERIMEGLRTCLLVKNMTEISVSDIASASGVSRSTFYRSFDMPLDVLSYACNRVFDMIIRDFSQVDLKDADELIHYCLKYWRRHTDILDAAVNCDRLDIVQSALENHSDRFIGDSISLIKKDFTEAELEYITRGAVGLISNLLIVWIRHGKKETPDQLFEFYLKCREILLDFHRSPLSGRRFASMDKLGKQVIAKE